MKEGHVIAVSGECDAIIYTRARLQEHGRVIENPYLVVLFSGDGEIYEMEMPTLSAVIQWAHHMEPQILYVRTAGREQGEDDCDEIIALCRGTSHIVMSPLEFMQRLAALVPPGNQRTAA